MFPFHFGSRTCICMVQFLFSLPPSPDLYVPAFPSVISHVSPIYVIQLVQCHQHQPWTFKVNVIVFQQWRLFERVALSSSFTCLTTDHIEHQLHMFNLGVSTLFPNVFLTLSCVFIWFIWLITLFSAIWHTLWIEESIIISDPDLNGSLSRAVHAYDGNELTLWIPEFSDESPQLSFYLTGVFFRSFSLQQLCWFFP